MHLPLGLLSPPLFSLTIPKREYKKDKNATETSHKKFSEGQQAHVGMVSLVGWFFRLPCACLCVVMQICLCRARVKRPSHDRAAAHTGGSAQQNWSLHQVLCKYYVGVHKQYM